VLILPVLMLCLFGTIEIGRVLHDYHVIVKSVRDGTRFLTRFPVECTAINVDGIFVDDQGNPDNTNKTYGENLTKRGSIDPDADYLVGAWSNAGSQLITRVECNPPGTLEGLYLGESIVPSIHMSAEINFHFFGTLPLLPNTIDFTVSHKEIWIGE
jgi:hypothetical protein